MIDAPRPEIFLIVKAAVEELEADRAAEQREAIDHDTVLFAEAGPLDSLALVRLIADLEMRVEDALGASIVLADERAMSRGNPYRTVGSLVDLICDRLSEVPSNA